MPMMGVAFPLPRRERLAPFAPSAIATREAQPVKCRRTTDERMRNLGANMPLGVTSLM
jgi:hypothetical protein